MDANKIQILLELLSSSSSSEDENEILLLLTRNPIPKVKGYVEDVIHEMTEKQVKFRTLLIKNHILIIIFFKFKERFRLNRSTVYEIINDYEQSQPYITDTTHGGSISVSAETQILSFIW